MTKPSGTPRARGLKFAVSFLAMAMGAGFASTASAQDAAAPEGVWNEPSIIVNNNIAPLAPPPGGALDNTVNLTGIGMMAVRNNPANTGFGVCSGTLINPRTVLFAAHCVNTRPAEAYGSANGTPFGAWTTGGTPISFGFAFDNFGGLLSFFGLDGAGLAHQTNTAVHLYNVEHVWYDPRSLAPSSFGFLEADVAVATLDTPAVGIPTWVMLFTPLQTQTHATIAGYGGNGTSASVQAGPLPSGNTPIDFRRRAAENMISFLGSLDDRNDWVFGPAPPINPQTLYQLDFDSPAGEGTYTGTAPNYDFDIFQGTALPREGITAGGDSGGPLIADQYFAGQQVVVATLSGGSRFHTNQRFATYGTTSFYQPLFMFWQEVVSNNPYVYAANKAGNRSWADPSHWVQQMDPAYGIEVGGQLVNALPGFNSVGVSGDTYRFGEVCFLSDCTDNADDPEAQPFPVFTPNSIFVPGGPGATNFVPNNVVANPSLGIRPRYYDVTLSGHGVTWLNSTVTVDRFTLDGHLTALDVRAGAVLNVLTDFNILNGAVEVDGRINAGEALMVHGLMTGRGTFNPSFFTSVDGAIAPGDLIGVGTLSIQGDVVLASGSELLIELGKSTNDLLRVLADPAQGTTGLIGLGGDVWFTPAIGAGAPRHNQTYTFVTADGGVLDSFDDVHGFLGILRPTVSYTGNTAQVKLKAGSFFDLLRYNPLLAPFAYALDQIRENHYASLYDLYGTIDLMDVNSLSGVFSGFQPTSLLDVRGLTAMQDSGFADTLQDRLSLLSRSNGAPMGLSIMGSPNNVFAFSGDEGFAAATQLSFESMLTQSNTVMDLPEGMSAFFTGGYDEARASAVSGRSALSTDDGLRTWRMAGGLEQRIGDNLTVGAAASYTRGRSLQTGSGALAETELTQSAVYGVYRFDNGAFVSGLVGAGSSNAETERRFAAGSLDYHMQGQTGGSLYIAAIEAGVNIDVMSGVLFTPSVGFEHMTARFDAFAETGGETALAFEEQVYNRIEARAGARLSGDFAFASGWRLAPSIEANAVANMGGDEGGVWARFAAVPDAPFYLPGNERDDFWGEISGGLALQNGDTSFALQFEQSVGRQELYEDRAMARFTQKF